MISLSYTNVPDVDAYARDIHAEGSSISVDAAQVKLLAEEYSARFFSASCILSLLLGTVSEGKYYSISTDTVVKTLVEFCGCKHSQFTSDTGKISLDMVKVVDPLISSLADIVEKPGYIGFQYEDALLLLKTYKEYKSLFTRKNQINAKLNKFSTETHQGWGKQLRSASFHYEACETGRFYTQNDSIQNWPLEMCSAITVPQDYFLFWCDFDQIDFRVGYHIFLRERDSEEDKIYLAAEDKYRGMYEIICRAANKEPDFDLFTKHRKAYKKAILSAMYNASEQSLCADIKNYELAHELYEYFKNNQRYQEFRRSIDRLINFNIDISVTDYFGFKRSIPMPNLHNTRDVNDAISKCCNTPIQSTSNSIMILWLEKTLEEFEKHGYMRDIHITPYLIRHDECIFKVHKSVLKDLYLFRNSMSVAIDDWDIITLEPHLGFYYKKPVASLEADYEASCIKNASAIQMREVKLPRGKRYRPVQEVLDVYVYDMVTILDRAKANFNPETMRLPAGVSTDSKLWSAEDALQILEVIVAQNPNSTTIKNILEYRNKILVHSRKLNKYKLFSSLDYAVACARELDTNKVNIYNVGMDSSMMHEGVMFRISTTYSDKVESLFSQIKALEYPEEWVTLH